MGWLCGDGPKRQRGRLRITASQRPGRVIVRLSDFKTNEYANLIGGEAFGPESTIRSLGWWGTTMVS
jgi:pyruvate, water dikinase